MRDDMPHDMPDDMRGDTLDHYALGRALPPEVASGGMLWIGYRRYPVFGARWLLGRALLCAVPVGIVAAMVGLGLGLTTRDSAIGVRAGLYFFLAFFAMCNAGPLLATLVRHARMPLRRERVLVVAALLVGVVISGFADSWASTYLEQVIPRSVPLPAPPELGPVQQGLLTALNVATAIVIYGVLGGGLAVRAYFSELGRWQEARHARELADSRARSLQSELRLGVLQAQVEPHFLFNTLASVRALLRESPGQAEATLDALVDYLRASIPRLREGATGIETTVGGQLELCARYLEVMHLRTGGRLQYSVEADADVRALPMPPMLLITLAENAVKHGIEPKPGPGRIALRARRESGTLRLEVKDDGVGLRPGAGGGLGLQNLRAQLQAHYGARASLRLESREGGGTRAMLSLPLPDVAADAPGHVNAGHGNDEAHA